MPASTDPMEIITRGQLVFETQIEPVLAGHNPENFVAIDILSGDYEANADDMVAEDMLLARRPEAILFVRRVGTHAAHFVGKGYRP